MNIFQVVKRPVVTEKSFALASKGQYTFEVAEVANKEDVAKAVELLYKGTKVAKVAITRLPGKRVFWRTRGRRPIEGKRSGLKKALVSLSEGKIEAFEKK